MKGEKKKTKNYHELEDADAGGSVELDAMAALRRHIFFSNPILLNNLFVGRGVHLCFAKRIKSMRGPAKCRLQPPLNSMGCRYRNQ